MAHLEQSVVRAIQSAQEVVVNRHAADAAVSGQHSGLRLDQLRREDALHGAEQRVAAHQIQISTQLFHTVNLSATFDLDRHVRPRRIPASKSTGPIGVGCSRRTRDRPGASASGCSASSACRCASTPSFCRPGSTPSSWEESWNTSASPIWSVSPSRPRTSHEADSGSPFSVESWSSPRRSQLDQRAGRAHPVQRLVGTVVGVDRYGSVGLDQDQPRCHRQVGCQPPCVVHLATGNHQPHGDKIRQGDDPLDPRGVRQRTPESTGPFPRASVIESD